MKRRRFLIATAVIVPILTVTVILLDRYCPASGLPLTSARSVEYRLKNRSPFPSSENFDARVTLPALLEPGDDENRWSEARAARVEGYVVSVGRAGIEMANCWSPCRRDIHINLALRSDAPRTEHVVVEVTPYFERSAKSQGRDWSAETLERTLVGHWCRFEGWLFYDRHHAKEATNTYKEGADVWRATAWEIHPVTKIEVLDN
ncbi:MAG TPA: hypothetical protein VLA93_01085 [Pyrinomonadaceae bacterium]|nr:hypothetical protein [Pyrinomonadaceae bacterium]